MKAVLFQVTLANERQRETSTEFLGNMSSLYWLRRVPFITLVVTGTKWDILTQMNQFRIIWQKIARQKVFENRVAEAITEPGCVGQFRPLWKSPVFSGTTNTGSPWFGGWKPGKRSLLVCRQRSPCILTGPRGRKQALPRGLRSGHGSHHGGASSGPSPLPQVLSPKVVTRQITHLGRHTEPIMCGFDRFWSPLTWDFLIKTAGFLVVQTNLSLRFNHKWNRLIGCKAVLQ